MINPEDNDIYLFLVIVTSFFMPDKQQYLEKHIDKEKNADASRKNDDTINPIITLPIDQSNVKTNVIVVERINFFSTDNSLYCLIIFILF